LILIIDNYDSFVYNLAQYVGELGWEPIVYRNDEIDLARIQQLSPTHIIISPGPGTPLDAGISNDVVEKFAGIIPILGVCLGHQCVGHVFGGRIVRADLPMHGKASIVYHDGNTIYDGIQNPFEAGRYHSLIVEPKSVPDVLEISAWTNTGEIMGVRHKQYLIEGTQIHPESILTDVGHDILKKFLKMTEAVWSR
jgi:anthranilate synthase component 2/para-aminobenzoate synthetase component 2